MSEVFEYRNLFEVKCNVLLDTREDDAERTSWHSFRGLGIGGSDVSKILGMSKYGSPLTVWKEKLKLSKPFEGNFHTKFGNRMEDSIRDWVQEDFKEATGIELKTYEYPFMMQSKEHPYMLANIDGLGILLDNYTYYENLETGEKKVVPLGEYIGIEIKTASEFLSRMWAGDEIPTDYYFQVQHYMAVTGLNYFMIVYLIGKRVAWKVIPRCDADIEIMIQKVNEFWNENIIKVVEPEPIGLPCDTEAILEGQVVKDDKEVTISNNLIGQYAAISDTIKTLEKEKETLKQFIFKAMDNNKKATDGSFKLSRFTVSRDKVDLKRLKEQYPKTYADVLEGKTEYINVRVTEVK